MKKYSNDLIGIFARYLSVLFLGLGNLYLVYFIFTPITVWVFYVLMSIFTDVSLFGNIVVVGGNLIEIVPACVSGAAYYLLFSLGMLTKGPLKTRIKVISTSIAAFFVFNIIRLLILTSLIGNSSFDLIHWVFWHLISTIFVVLIWLFVTKKYKMKGFPVYSDLLYLKKLKKKKTKRKK